MKRTQDLIRGLMSARAAANSNIQFKKRGLEQCRDPEDSEAARQRKFSRGGTAARAGSVDSEGRSQNWVEEAVNIGDLDSKVDGGIGPERSCVQQRNFELTGGSWHVHYKRLRPEARCPIAIEYWGSGLKPPSRIHSRSRLVPGVNRRNRANWSADWQLVESR